MKNNKGNDLKNKIAIITCIVSFGLGWSLTIAGFCIPPLGEISSSVLWVLGQSLLYCSSVLGISIYVNSQLKNGFSNIRHDLRLEEEQKEE